jgi:hypothetical protein
MHLFIQAAHLEPITEAFYCFLWHFFLKKHAVGHFGSNFGRTGITQQSAIKNFWILI